MITLTYPAGNAVLSNQAIQFSIFSHSKVTASNGNCASSCDSINGYSTGIDYSSVPPKCIDCDTSVNIAFDPSTGSCSCGPGFSAGSAGCQPCTVTLCGYCSIDTTSCSACVPNSHFINVSDKKQGCTCDDGFYKSGSQCLPCAPGCATCTKST